MCSLEAHWMMVKPRTFAIHKNSPCRVDTWSELSRTKRWNGLPVHHVNNSVFSVYVFCMRFFSYRYHFIVFNASVLYFQTVRPLLRPGRCLHLVPSLRQVVQSLEEVADQDHSWRAELMMQVTPQCSPACLSWISPVLIQSHMLGSWGRRTELTNQQFTCINSFLAPWLIVYSPLWSGEYVLCCKLFYHDPSWHLS